MSRRHRGFGERVYVVTDAEGIAQAYGTEAEAESWAAQNAPKGQAFVFEGGRLDDQRPNPAADPGAVAYRMSGLQAVCRAKYGVDHLTADLVDSIPLLEAQERIRPYLPPSKGYDVGWRSMPKAVPKPSKGGAPKSYGMLGANGKLSKSENFEDTEVVCFGLSLAPHRSGLRPVGTAAESGFAFYRDKGGKLFVNTEKGKDYLFAVSSRDPENPLYAEYGGPKNGDGHLGVEAYSGVNVRVSRPTVCAYATGGDHGCIANCLVHSGQNPASDEALASKLALTAALYADPAAFCKVLLETVRRFFYFGGTKDAKRVFVRLNVFSDIPWERFFPDLLDPYMKLALRQFDTKKKQYGDWRDRPVVGRGSFYDYTKVPRRVAGFVLSELRGRYPGRSDEQLYRAAAKYYWLTFSYSGNNLDEAKKVLENGGTVAVVFVTTARAAGDDAPLDGPPLVGITKDRVDRLAYDYGFLRNKRLHSPVKHVWMYARDNSQTATFKRVLGEYGAEVPDYMSREERFQFAAKLISHIVGRKIPVSALRLGVTKGGKKTMRKEFEGQWWYPFSFLGRPVINADANDLRGMDQALITNRRVGRAKQVAALQAKGLLGPTVPPGTIVGLDFKPPMVKTEADYWQVTYRAPGKESKILANFVETEAEAKAIAAKTPGAKYKKAGRMTGGWLDLNESKFVTGVERTPDGKFVAPQTPWATDRGQE